MKVIVLLLIGLAACCFAADVNINQAVDELIDSAKTALVSSGKNKIKIKDLDKTFEKTFFGKVKVQGEFKATGGEFSDLATLHRTGDVLMDTEGSTITLTASMGLSTLQVAFQQYDFHILAIQSSGSMQATCKSNSISAKIKVTYSGGKNCTVSVEQASIDALGQFDVKMTGPGALNELGSMLFTWVLNHFNENIRGLVNANLQSSLQQALSKVDICKKLPIPPPS